VGANWANRITNAARSGKAGAGRLEEKECAVRDNFSCKRVNSDRMH